MGVFKQLLIRKGRGYRNRGRTIKWWYSLEIGSWFLLKEICITMSLSPHPGGGWELQTEHKIPGAQLCCLTTNQSKKEKKTEEGHKPCSPHPKCCLLFLGTSDDHPVRSPVWPLSIPSLRGANSFKLKCCYYKGECWFQSRQKNTLT